MISDPESKPIAILLVEDNPADVRLTQEALKEGQVLHTLHTVKDGIEAMAFLRRERPFEDAPRPDLIFLDLNLPRKDGREVLREIKSDEKLRRIPVVILTTSKAEDDILKTYSDHANCFITKPVDLDHFIDVIKTIKQFWMNIVTLPSQCMNEKERAVPDNAPAPWERPEEKMKDQQNEYVRLSEPESDMPSILLIEDNPADERLIRIMVAEIWGDGIVLRHASRLSEGVILIEAEKSDVILLDLGLPDSLGLESVERFCGIAPEIPVIVLTGLDDEMTGNEAVRKGAQDYLVKSQFDGRALKKAVKYAIERKRWDRTREKLIRELQDALNKIKVLKGLVPICACCKNIRNDKGFWERIESYIKTHSDVEFTHSICPNCEKKYYSELSEDQQHS